MGNDSTIDSAVQSVEYFAKGFVGCNAIISDTPGSGLSEKFPLFDNVSRAPSYEFYRMSLTEQASPKMEYFAGCGSGALLNIAARLYFSSQVDNMLGKVAVFFSPEIATFTAGILRTLPQEYTIRKETDI